MPNEASVEFFLQQIDKLFQASAGALLKGELENVRKLNDQWATLHERASDFQATKSQQIHLLLLGSKRHTHRGQYEELLNRFENAENHYLEANRLLEEIRQTEGSDELLPDQHLILFQCEGYGYLGNLLRKLSRKREASHYNQRAIDSLPDEPGRLDNAYPAYLTAYSDVYNAQAMNLTDDRRFDEATKCYEKLLAFNRKHDFIVGQVQTLNNLGVLWYQRSFGQDDETKAFCYKRAIGYLKQARALNQHTSNPNFLNAVTDDVNLGTLYCGLKEFKLATEHLGHALDKLDNYAGGLMGMDLILVRENQAFCEQMMVSALVNNKQNRDAFVFLEQRRSRILAERKPQPGKVTYQLQGNNVREVLQPREAFITYSGTDQDKFVVIVVRKDRTAALEIIYYDFVEKLYKKHQALCDRLLGTKTRFTQQVPYQNHVPSLIQKRHKNYNLLRLIHLVRILIERQDMFDLGLIRTLSREFHALLIEPIMPYLADADHIHISTDASLGFIPFEVLCNDHGAYLIETFSISYVRTLNHLAYLQARGEQRKAHEQMLIVKNSVYVQQQPSHDVPQPTVEERREILRRYHQHELTDQDFNRLYGSTHFPILTAIEKEVREIMAAVPQAKLLTAASLTKQEFIQKAKKGELVGYRHVHFALHGVAYPDMPQLSALIFYHQEASLKKAFLTLPELEELNIEADFVSLAACETAVGGIYQSEGMVGIAQTLLRTGTDSVLSTLWEVDSDNSVLFMSSFYKHLGQSGAYAETLRRLKINYIRQSTYLRHPAYWAAFVVHGLGTRKSI